MHMERVKGQQLHLRRVLDKQLEGIEHTYRQTEAKRDREIRSLGIDLTKLKNFTKDVDHVFTDNTPRPLTRRASLPALTTPRPLTSPAVSTTGRLRRSSVVTPPIRSRLELLNASTLGNLSPRIHSSQTSLDLKATNSTISARRNSLRRASNSSDGSGDKNGDLSARRRSLEHHNPSLSNSTAPSDGMTHDDIRRGSTAAVKVMSTQEQLTRRNSKSGIEAQPKVNGSKSPARNGERRSSLDNGSKTPSTNGKATRRGSKSSEPDVSHNETKVYIHRDGQEPILVSEKESVPDAGSGMDEESSGSMFDSWKSRRISEPALGSHFLRALQAKINIEESPEVKTHHALTPAEEELRKSIAKDLPSTIVAEEDEDRYNEENSGETTTETTTSKTTDSETSPKEEIKAEPDVKPKKVEPVSRQDSNGKPGREREESISVKSNGRVPIQDDDNTEKQLLPKPEKTSMGKALKSQQRRKSEGDVLRFARIWNLQAGNGLKNPQEEPSKETSGDSAKIGIWDAVRKCRYIRGYNPPDMAVPEDLSEFVFGDPNPDPVITTE